MTIDLWPTKDTIPILMTTKTRGQKCVVQLENERLNRDQPTQF